jgi:hypothetical protein
MKILSRKTGNVKEVSESAWRSMVSTGQARYYQVVKEQPEVKMFQRIERFEEPVVDEPKRRRRKSDTNQDE